MTALDDEIPDVRGFAAKAIGTFGPEAKAAIPKLIAKLSDQGITVSLEGVWVSFSQTLGRIGPAAIGPMLAAIEGSDRLTYLGIMGALGEMKTEASGTVPTLIELLRTCPEDRRWATIYALCGIGAPSRPAVDDLVKQLDHEDFNIQCIACRALAEIGPPAKPAVPKLLHLIENGIVSSRGQAAICLGAIGPVEGVDSVGILVQLLKANDQITRERAMIGLGHLGPAAIEAKPVVEQALNDPDFWPKPEAARTLWLISGDASQAVPKLVELMSSFNHDLRAMEVLAEIGPQAEDAADELARRLESEDQGIRLLAAKALRGIGPGAKQHLDALTARLQDSDPDVVEALHAAISAMSPAKSE